MSDIANQEHLCSPMKCDECGFEWMAVHPICEWLECECGHWNQVPPVDHSEDAE